MTLVFKIHNGPTPADGIAPQIITDRGNLTLDFKQLGLWASPPFLQTLGPWTILIRLRFSRLVVHLFLPHYFLPLNFLLTCLDTALCEQLLWQWMFVSSPPCEGLSMIVFWTTVRSAVFPMIVSPSEPNWEIILKAQETFAGVLSWLADWHVTIFKLVEIVNWWGFVKCEPKS